MKRWMTVPFALLCAGAIALAQPRVVVNEILYDDASTDDLEFVELYNAGDQPANITGWRLESGDQLTGDNNADYVIGDTDNDGNPDITVILQPGQFYVLGSSLVPNVNQVIGANNLFENDNEWAALRDADGNVVDAIAYETMRAPDFATWVPEDARTQLGRGIWGEKLSLESGSNDNTFMSWARYIDGYDTDDNGRDFGLLRATPGASNAVVFTEPFCENFNTLEVGTVVPNFTGTWRNARVIDPTQSTGGADFNPNPIFVSPDGGKAMVAWDWSGGGNAVLSDFVFNGSGGIEAWVYFDNTPLPANGTVEHESWAIGIMGTSDTYYRPIPFTNPTVPANLPPGPGITGLAWVYHRYEVEDGTTVVRLIFVDARSGGDSNNDWHIYQSFDMTEEPTGWYRLRIQVREDGEFSASFTPNEETPIGVSGYGQTNLVGQAYIAYREFISNNANCRPPTLDDLCVFVPTGCDRSIGDVNCDGCVDDADLLQVLFAFGSEDQNTDVNGDGIVDDADLLVVLFNFGSGC